MNKKGFTLVELLAVIAILAILVIIALPNVLKMFNDSKKNSFLTEAKTVYNEVSKKYISESMKGNKLTYVSSEDNTKLDMTGKKLQYCVLLNADGSVKSMKVLNGEWIVELPDNKKITDLKITDLKQIPTDYKFECMSASFADDSWATIASNVKAGNTSKYNVGDTKEVDLGTYGKHMVRISNLNTPSECNQEGFSQSACGFVVEFTDIITTHVMNATGTNIGGWPASDMYKFLNDENDSNSIINLLPIDLKKNIINTETISEHGDYDSENFKSLDKLYFLVNGEIYGDWSLPFTRQLDFYEDTTRNDSNKAIKMNNETAELWWTRSAVSDYSKGFGCINANGGTYTNPSTFTLGVSPAFRIG